MDKIYITNVCVIMRHRRECSLPRWVQTAYVFSNLIFAASEPYGNDQAAAFKELAALSSQYEKEHKAPHTAAVLVPVNTSLKPKGGGTEDKPRTSPGRMVEVPEHSLALIHRITCQPHRCPQPQPQPITFANNSPVGFAGGCCPDKSALAA